MEKGKKIDSVLVIDDDQVHNYLAEIIFASYNVKSVTIEGNGHSAIGYLDSLTQKCQPLPDLILLDVHMPVLDGFEFMRIFERMECSGKSEVLVVLISASVPSYNYQPLTFKLYPKVLPKPLTKNKLLAILEEYPLKVLE